MVCASANDLLRSIGYDGAHIIIESDVLEVAMAIDLLLYHSNTTTQSLSSPVSEFIQMLSATETNTHIAATVKQTNDFIKNPNSPA